MVTNYYAYIDEAGDEGFGKLRTPGGSGQSRWFAIGGIIVTQDNDRLLPLWRDEVMAMFPHKRKRRDLHFRYLNHGQRVVASRVVAEKPVGICVVASNKETILDAQELNVFKRKQHLYNYLVRFMMERITAACALKARQDGVARARLHVTFSRRAGTDYQVMRDYFRFMRDGREKIQPTRSINWTVFSPDDIRVENHAMRAGLQIADVVTSATYSALEPNEFGDIETRYALLLKQRYLRERSNILNCGLTIIPPVATNPLSDQQRHFIEQIRK